MMSVKSRADFRHEDWGSKASDAILGHTGRMGTAMGRCVRELYGARAPGPTRNCTIGGVPSGPIPALAKTVQELSDCQLSRAKRADVTSCNTPASFIRQVHGRVR